MGLLDTIAPTPRNKLLGLLADAAQGVSDFAAKPFGYNNPPGELVAGLLGVPDIAKTLDRLSYGEPLTTGTGMTLRPREEAVNAAMAALPLGATLGKGAIDAGVYAAKKATPAIERAVPRIMESGGFPAEILRGMSQQTVSPLTVWHGSPHKFDKFDASKIGTGEGAQAYGHGLYVAESPDVAMGYQQKLSGMLGNQNNRVFLDGSPLDFANDAERRAWEIVARDGIKNASATARRLKAESFDTTALEAAIKQAKGKSVTIDKDNGNLYKIDLPDEHIAKMLDWDKPLSQQAPEVQSALKRYMGAEWEPSWSNLQGVNAYDVIAGGRHGNPTGNVAAAEKLRSAGIPGIRYLDGGSRGTGAGTSNFVVFPGNEEILKILERNGKPVGLLGN